MKHALRKSCAEIYPAEYTYHGTDLIVLTAVFRAGAWFRKIRIVVVGHLVAIAMAQLSSHRFLRCWPFPTRVRRIVLDDTLMLVAIWVKNGMFRFRHRSIRPLMRLSCCRPGVSAFRGGWGRAFHRCERPCRSACCAPASLPASAGSAESAPADRGCQPFFVQV